MLISTIQGQTLASPIALESALLELLEIAATNTTENTTGQAATTYSDDTLNASISLPIAQATQPNGSVVILAIDNSIPERSTQ